MAYPPAELPADFLNETDAETGVDDAAALEAEGGTPGEGEHAERHNAAAEAINDIVGELGANPSGASATVQARMEAMGLTLAAKADTTAVTEALAAKASKAELAAEESARISGLAGKAATVHAHSQYDEFDSLPGELPDRPGTTLQWTAKRCYLARFTPRRKREYKGLRFPITTNNGAEDKVDVGLYRWTGTKFELLGSSGAKAVSTNVINSKYTTFTATVTVEPGNTYYRAMSWETLTGTPQVAAVLNNNGTYGDIFGTTNLQNRFYLFKEATFPLPATIETVGGSTVCPWLVPSES